MKQEDMSSHQPIASPEPLSLPHFDEEATLLSARRVVPLHEVRAATRSRHRLIFASTIVAAMVLGGIGASLLFIRDDKLTNTVAEREQGLSVNRGSDSSPPNQSDPLYDTPGKSPADQTVQSVESATITALTKAQTDQTSVAAPTSPNLHVNRAQASWTPSASRLTHAKPAKPAPNTSAQTALADQNNDDDLEVNERRLRREERREWRRSRREQQPSSHQSSDGLMRIREIFEGIPRP